jgi:hypothetical protein
LIDPEPTFDGTAQLLPLFFFLIKYQLPAFQPSDFHFGGLLSSNRVSFLLQRVYCFGPTAGSAIRSLPDTVEEWDLRWLRGFN